MVDNERNKISVSVEKNFKSLVIEHLTELDARIEEQFARMRESSNKDDNILSMFSKTNGEGVERFDELGPEQTKILTDIALSSETNPAKLLMGLKYQNKLCLDNISHTSDLLSDDEALSQVIEAVDQCIKNEHIQKSAPIVKTPILKLCNWFVSRVQPTLARLKIHDELVQQYKNIGKIKTNSGDGLDTPPEADTVQKVREVIELDQNINSIQAQIESCTNETQISKYNNQVDSIKERKEQLLKASFVNAIYQEANN